MNCLGSARWAVRADFNKDGNGLELQRVGAPSPDALILGRYIDWSSTHTETPCFGAHQTYTREHPATLCWTQSLPLNRALNRVCGGGERNPLRITYGGGLSNELSPTASSLVGTYLQKRGEGHLLTFAPTGAGKGIGVVLPNLLNWEKSVLVFDPKGENFKASYHYREKGLGQKIFLFDPFEVVDVENAEKYRASFATLGKLQVEYDRFTKTGRPGNLYAEASAIASALVVRHASDEKNPYFNNAAQRIIKAALILVCYQYEGSRLTSPPLSAVRTVLREAELTKIRNKIKKQYHPIEEKEEFLQVPLGSEEKLLKAKCEVLLALLDDCCADAQNRDTLGTVRQELECLEDEPIANLLDAKSDRIFWPEYGLEHPCSIYIVLPVDKLTRHQRTIRVLLSRILDAKQKLNDGTKQMLFLLDEVAQFGRLEILHTIATIGRCYGIILWMIWQDLGQLSACYPNEWKSFEDNACVQQFFGCQGQNVAELVSRKCGERGVIIEQRGEQYGHGRARARTSSGFFSRNTDTDTYNETVNTTVTEVRQSVPLIRPEQVRLMPPDLMTVFRQGVPPILCKRPTYIDPRFEENHLGSLRNEEHFLLERSSSYVAEA